MHKKLIWRIALSILLIALIIVLFIVVGNHNSYATNDGEIIVLINDKENNIVSKERLSFKKDDTLYKLIKSNYNLEDETTSYGHFLKGISKDNFSLKTNGFDSWLWFELFYLKDGKDSKNEIDFNDYDEQNVSTGIDGIELVPNMIFAINERDSLHEASVLNNSNIVIKNNDKLYFILSIVLISIIIASIIIFFIVDLIKNRSINPIKVKDIAIMVMLAALLFVQEEALTLIPNIQFTFLLIMLYGAVLGPKKASLIVLVHVLLDNLFMSSFIPTVMLPMLIGHEITMLIGYYLKNKNTIILSIGITIASIIYAFLFFITTIFVYDINPLTYLIADIPFDIILIACNILCVILIYSPLYKILNENINNEMKAPSES
ncbi:MAG: ECF transporter S component [Acholeplasmatales bacterium]|nr:ECF transporter S component [Acholeplasmatales bacterium]